MCEDLTIRNITVKNPWYSQNGDGLDIESCRNTVVYNCNFDVGDDAICLKSGKDADGRKRAMPTENLVIRNCIVFHGHGGVTIGSEMSGGVKICFTDINMINIPTQAISFNMYYGGLSHSEIPAEGRTAVTKKEVIPQATEETPLFRNISIKNLTCKGANQAILLQGLPEMNLENIILENIDIEADNGLLCIDADSITIKGMRLITKNIPSLSFMNSRNVVIDKLDVPFSKNPYIDIKGDKSKYITIRTINSGEKGNAIVGNEVDAGTIKIF
jgi:hypothetical protein